MSAGENGRRGLISRISGFIVSLLCAFLPATYGNLREREKERGVVFGMVGTDVFYDGCPSGLAFISYWGIVLFGYDT